MSKKKPKAPPPPPAPNYATLWKEYSGWTANAASQRDTAIGNARSRLTAAGAGEEVIKAAEAQATEDYESKIKEYQSSSTYSLLTEGYDIARGAKSNIYSGKAAGQLYSADGPMEDYTETTTTGSARMQREGLGGTSTVTKQRGALNTLEAFYAGGYDSGEVDADPRGDALKKTKLQAGGGGGGSSDIKSQYDISDETPGANPWVA